MLNTILEQVIANVRKLQPHEQEQVAKVLIEEKLRSDLAALIGDLYAQQPADDITDDDIMLEINAVRQQAHSA